MHSFQLTVLQVDIFKIDLLASVTRPTSCGSDLKYLLQKSADSRAINNTFPRKYPAVCPTELHVLAQPTLRLENINVYSLHFAQRFFTSYNRLVLGI